MPFIILKPFKTRMSKPSILFVLHLPPPVHGAAMVGKYIQNSRIINADFNTTYINLSTSVELTAIGKHSWEKIITLLKIQAKVVKALCTHKYDLCYMTLTAKGPGFYKDLMIVTILKLFRRNIIYHFHNKGVATRQHRIINHFLYSFAFKNTKCILLSQMLYTDIAKYVRSNRVYYCANGVPEADNICEVNRRSTTAGEVCQLLFLSNMMVEKGVLVLLDACKILAEKNIQFNCHFVGAWDDITEEDFINATRMRGLSKFVFAYGKKLGIEKLNYFKNADIFIFPSFYHNETFGLVTLEAMQFKLPVISTLVGGIPDVVKDGETGFLIPPNDATALAKVIELLIQQPDLRLRLGEQGKKRYEEYFKLERFEQNFKTILENAITLK